MFNGQKTSESSILAFDEEFLVGAPLLLVPAEVLVAAEAHHVLGHVKRHAVEAQHADEQFAQRHLIQETRVVAG